MTSEYIVTRLGNDDYDSESLNLFDAPLKRYPFCLDEFDQIRKNFATLIACPARVYFLSSGNIRNTNLANKSSFSKDHNDAIHLIILRLCRQLSDFKLRPIIIFDNISDLIRFQKVSVTTVLVNNAGSYPIAQNPINSDFFQFFRKKHIYKRYDFMNVSHLFPENSKKIPLFLSTDKLFDAEFQTVIYFKNTPQFFGSGFPKIKSNEAAIESRLSKKVPFFVFISDSTSIPFFGSSSTVKFMPLGIYEPETLDFKPIENSFAAEFFMQKNNEIIDVFNQLESNLGKLYFSILLLTVIYNSKSSDVFDDSQVRKITENITLRNKIRDLSESLHSMCSFLELSPKISSWRDIYELRKQMKKEKMIIKYIPQLHESMKLIFQLIFHDAIIFHNVFKNYERNGDFETFTGKLNSLLSELNKTKIIQSSDYSDDDVFDPESSVGYIASDYADSKNYKEKVEADYFVLQNGSRKFIYYCNMGKYSKVTVEGASTKKYLYELKPGDVIEKKYWNYETLKTRIKQFLAENLHEDPINEWLDESDLFRSKLVAYALSNSNPDLQTQFGGLCKTHNMKSVFMCWAIETMCPNEEKSYELFAKVIEVLKTTYSITNLDPKTLYQKMKKIKQMRRYFKEDKERKERYTVIQGPIKTHVEVEKLGRLYRFF